MADVLQPKMRIILAASRIILDHLPPAPVRHETQAPLSGGLGTGIESVILSLPKDLNPLHTTRDPSTPLPLRSE